MTLQPAIGRWPLLCGAAGAVALMVWLGLAGRSAALNDELADVLPGTRCADASFAIVSDDSWDGSRTVRIDRSADCVRSITDTLAGFRKTLPGFARDGVVPDGDAYRDTFGVDSDRQGVTWIREGK